MSDSSEISTAVLRLASEISGLTVEMITSRCRKQPLPAIRAVIAKELGLRGMHERDIAPILGVDRTSVLHYQHKLFYTVTLRPTIKEKPFIEEWKRRRKEL